MPLLTTWVLVAAVAAIPPPGADIRRQIDVFCQSDRALERALARAPRLGEVDIILHGVCEGHFVIVSDGITLRGANRDSGLAAPDGDSSGLPVLRVIDAKTGLRGLIVRGGEIGVLARGWDAEVFLSEVDVRGQTSAGVVASRGAFVGLFDSTVRGASVGVAAESSSQLNLQRVTVSDQQVGVIVTAASSAALSNATIAGNQQAGLVAQDRSDVNILGGVFRENGQAHLEAGEWSTINLLSDVTIGSEGDPTPYALGAIRGATIASYSAPAIFGDVGVLDGGSIQFGNTVLNGDLSVQQFAHAYVRAATITGSVYCADGSDAICSGVATGGVFGCPSSTCGPPTPAPGVQAPAARKFPEITVPRFDATAGKAESGRRR